MTRNFAVQRSGKGRTQGKKESSRELFDLDNVIMTPHMAATTEQSVLNCCTSVANDIVAVCNGEEPKVKAQKPKF